MTSWYSGRVDSVVVVVVVGGGVVVLVYNHRSLNYYYLLTQTYRPNLTSFMKWEGNQVINFVRLGIAFRSNIT